MMPGATVEQIPEIHQIYRTGTQQLSSFKELPGVRALRGESTSANDLEIYRPDKIIPIECWGTPIYHPRNGRVITTWLG